MMTDQVENLLFCPSNTRQLSTENRNQSGGEDYPHRFHPQVKLFCRKYQNLNVTVKNPTLAVNGPLIWSPKNTDRAVLALGVGITSTLPIQGCMILTPKSFSVAWL